MRDSTSSKILLRYYDATAVFAAFDLLLGVNVRVAFLEGMPEWRTAYYVFCVACAVIMHLFPRIRILVGSIEGMVTLIGLILGMYSGYMLAHAESVGDFVQILLNYFISGYFAQLSWKRGLERLNARYGLFEDSR
jgi:hypothetical protein